MDIRFLHPGEFEEYSDEIFAMLSSADKEFVPPLSNRTSTTQLNLQSEAVAQNGILSYCNEMKKQFILLAFQDDVLLGFVSFKENYINDIIQKENCPNIYISTLVVKPEARGKGLTQAMYNALFEEYKTRYILTRTWSSNLAHSKILSKFGFKTLCTLTDDRGPGIDTVYFIKHPA